jgi:hypothetical protein
MLITVEYARKSTRKLFHTDEEASVYVDMMRENPAVIRITSPGRPTAIDADMVVMGEIVWYTREEK